MVEQAGRGFKALTLASLKKAVDEGRVDEDIIPLLFTINSHPQWMTTSSCSGRIQLIAPPTAGDKVGSEVLGKWHGVAGSEEVLKSLGGWSGEGELHLLVQPLLLHIRCRDLPSAVGIRNIGQEAGLKFSSIRSIRLDRNGDPVEWGITVEILGTERAEIPLHGLDDDVIRRSLPFWLVHSNSLLSRTKEHIETMIDLVKDPPEH
ncbi:MAG: tRNA-wybutosine modification methyltransferase TYW3 [Thermoplasmatota archaeon]